MPENLKTKSALIWDWGLFVEWAPRLAREFGEVKYFLPWANAYPKSNAAHVGSGLPGVERVVTFWDHVPDADIVIFPDIYLADVQAVVRNRFGKPVWGHGDAEFLELDRVGTRHLQKDLGIAAPRSKTIVGIDNLANYLSLHDKPLWIKISSYRGDGETWRHEAWAATQVYLDHFRDRVGALADEYEFLVEEEIPGIEVGFDGWTVRGQWPEACYYGFEIKDQAYVGRFCPYREMPSSVRDINSRIAPILEREGGSGFCSFEFRLTKSGTPYMIDPCLRCGSPPTEVMQEAYRNLPEIIWEGAHGRMVNAQPQGEYAVMALIHCSFALTNWVPVEVPPEVRPWVKLRNAAVIGGNLYHVPIGGEMPEIGAVVAVADSLEEACSLVEERALQVKGYNLDIKTAALGEAREEIEKAKEYGIDFL